MMERRLAELAALAARGDHDDYVRGARQLAAEAPGEVEAVVEAAYACDRYGDERDAVRYYDAAWQLGVPAALRQRFVVGYGSTLRNVGRTEEAIAILGEALTEYPDYLPIRVFLALALHTAGHAKAATATLLGALLDHAPAALDGYDRALTGYYRELLVVDEPAPR